MTASLKNAFLRFIRQNKLFDQNDKVLVALSGGVDSMVLLHLLLVWKRNLNLRLAALHINHKLRGRNSDRDERFVKTFCEQRGIPIHLEAANIRKFANENRYSLEEAGHIKREQIYNKYLRENEYDVVATAHNLNDQAETILMRILEGTGLDGLAGIRVKKTGIVRPLLFANRSQIESYAIREKIPHVEDRSNMDMRFKRNRVRHQLMPFLGQEFSFGNLDNFLKVSLILQEWFSFSEDYVKTLRKKVRVDRGKAFVKASNLKKQFSGFQIKLLEYLLEHLTGSTVKLNFNTYQGFKTWLESDKEGTKYGLNKDILVSRKKTDLVFQRIHKFPSKIELEIPNENVYNLSEPGIRFTLKEVKTGQVKFSDDHSVEFLDREKIHFPLILRNWKSGDKFQPLGAPFNRLVSDFLTDLKIEFPKKKEVLVLEQGGEIVAIPNFRISEKYKLTPQTRRVLKIEIRNEKQSRNGTD
jgi:tRNA(Ile)-lysidine synthase